VHAPQFFDGLVAAAERGVGAVAEQFDLQARAQELACDGVRALGLGAGA
jgi:hypothetical protein